MELRPCQPKVFHGPFDFLDGGFPLVRVNAGKAGKLLWVTLHDRSNIIVPQGWQTCSGFRVPGKQDTDHIEFRIIGGYLLDILQLDLGAEEALGGRGIRTQRDLHKLRRRQVDMKVDGAWHGMILQKR